MQFAKDLGPTAQMVARRKAERCFTEALKIANGNSNHPLQPPKNQIPEAGSSTQKGFTTSLKILENSGGSQNFSGRFSGFQSGSLNGDKASLVDTVNAWDALSIGGVSWAGSINEAWHDTKGKNILGGGMTEANKLTETLGDCRPKRVQTMSEGLGMSNSFKGVTTDRSTGIQSGSSAYGDVKFDFLSGWNTNSSPNKFSFSNMMQDALNVENHVQEADIGPSQLRMQQSVPPKYIGALSSSWQLPSGAMLDVSSRTQAIRTMDLMDSYYFGKRTQQNHNLADRGGPGYRGNLMQGDQFLNSSKPVELGPNPYVDGWLQQKSRSAGMNFSFPAGPSQQESWLINPTSGGGLHQINGLDDKGGPSCQGNLEQGGQVSNWSKWFKPVQLVPQPVGDRCFQRHSKLFEMDSPGQPGTSRQQQGWTITPSDGHVMNTSNPYDFEMHQTPREGDLSFWAPPDNHQKQPLLDTDLMLHWPGEH